MSGKLHALAGFRQTQIEISELGKSPGPFVFLHFLLPSAHILFLIY